MATIVERKPTVCLYRFFDKEGTLLYVGQSIDPFRRCSEHMASQLWFHEVETVKIEQYEGREAALDAEFHAIHGERPKHNWHSGRIPKAESQSISETTDEN